MDGFLLVHMDLHQIGFRMELVHGLPCYRHKGLKTTRSAVSKSINRLKDYFFSSFFFLPGA